MSFSCCICGLTLANSHGSLPQWCKQIGAVCWFGGGPVLSDSGYVDDRIAAPFNLVLSQHGYQRFYFRTPHDDIQDTCYPFHQACWSLLTECYSGKPLDCIGQTLFGVFESIHYHKRALRWGHNYHLEDLIESCSTTDSQEPPQEDIISANRAEPHFLADPLLSNSQLNDDLRQKLFGPLPFRWSRLQIGYSTTVPPPSVTDMRVGFNHSYLRSTISPLRDLYRRDDRLPGLLSLPSEILTLIMCNLGFFDLQKLLQVNSILYRRYGGDPSKIPYQFWQSRFWVFGETGFARSIRPSSSSWKDWFFTLKAEIRNGLNSVRLRNRRRIWKLANGLANILHAIIDLGSTLHGNATINPPLGLGQVTGAPQRELLERYLRLNDMFQLRSITPSYIPFSGEMLISGLSFIFDNGSSADIGYVVKKQAYSNNSCTNLPKFLWVVSSQLGFVSLTVGAYPDEIVGTINSQQLAVTRWRLENLDGICLGLDAMRTVRIRMDTNETSNIENILWTPSRPLLLPVIHQDDITALQQLQTKSYNPVSSYLIESSYGRLTSVIVYSALGRGAGITGLGFLYDTVSEHLWGTSDDAASLTFFLGQDEYITSVFVYKVESPVLHLEGHSKQLHCFGVIPTTIAIPTKTNWTPPEITPPPRVDNRILEMPLGDIRNHGSNRSRVSLQQQYHSIQASINPTRSRYRRIGQVTGLLFNSSHDPDHPDLLGQWTGAGEIYTLQKEEQIVDIQVTTIQPIQQQRNRFGLSQVENITVVTNRMRMRWSSIGCERAVLDHSHCQSAIKEASWEFNAIFDRLSYAY